MALFLTLLLFFVDLSINLIPLYLPPLPNREAEFTEYRPVRLFVGTWNVNGKFPKEDISAWLTEGADADVYLPDVYVVGLQEMVDLTAANVVAQAQCGKRSKEWLVLLQETLSKASSGGKEGERFELLGTHYLVGVMIAVLVKKKYRPFITGLQEATAAVGLFGVGGNKGGTALRFRLFDTTFCFVCAHLAAHQNAVAQRNNDYHAINAKIEFRDEGAGSGSIGGGEVDVAPSSPSASTSSPSTFGVFDHDFLVWLGDFNYRLSEGLPTEKVFELVGQPLGGGGGSTTSIGSLSGGALESLRRADQLCIERAAGRVFSGFSEGPLSFRPTYKFQVGTSLYEARPEKKLRPPAWCDRILWRTSPGVTSPRHWRQLFYGSVESIKASDHKPVHALFEVAVKTCMEDHRRRVVEDVCATLRGLENSSVPKLNVSVKDAPPGVVGDCNGSPDSGAPLGLKIQDAVCGLPFTITLELTNTGDVVAPWHLLSKTEEKAMCKDWVRVDPPYGVLTPRSSVTLTLTVLVNVAVARDLSLGRELAASYLNVSPSLVDGTAFPAALAYGRGVLEDILVIRAERGRDLYLPISVSVLPSAWGATLAQLSHRPEPMRALSVNGLASESVKTALRSEAPNGSAFNASGGSRVLGLGLDCMIEGGMDSVSRRGDVKMGVPKEIWRLVDALLERSATFIIPELFIDPPDPKEVIAVQSAIDCGDPLPASFTPVALGSALLDLLRSLREPLIPANLFPSLIDVSKSGGADAWCASTLRGLPPLHYNVLVFLCRFAREFVAATSNKTGTTKASVVDGISLPFSRAFMRRFSHEEAPSHAHYGQKNGEGPILEAGVGIGGKLPEECGLLAENWDFSDKSTRWEPTEEEGEAMKLCTAALFGNVSLSI